MTAVLVLRNPRELAELKTQLQQPDARAVLAEKVQPEGLEETQVGALRSKPVFLRHN
jgi:hypothetical protein